MPVVVDVDEPLLLEQPELNNNITDMKANKKTLLDLFPILRIWVFNHHIYPPFLFLHLSRTGGAKNAPP